MADDDKFFDVPFSKIPVTLSIIGIITIVFLWQIATAGIEPTARQLFEQGGQTGFAVYAHNEYWRLFTSNFLHGGITHFGFNMVALAQFGQYLEVYVGHWRTLVVYLIAGQIGSAGTLFLTEPFTVSVGASGAIFGVMAAFVPLIFIYRKEADSPIKSELKSIGIVSVIYIVYNLASGLGDPEIGNFAHIFGGIGGMLAVVLVGIPKERPGEFKLVTRILVGILIVVMMVSVVFYRPSL